MVRGGYGIYYNTSVYNVIAVNMAQQPPFAESLSASSSAGNPLSIQNAFLQASTKSSSSTYAVDQNYRIGYAQTLEPDGAARSAALAIRDRGLSGHQGHASGSAVHS